MALLGIDLDTESGTQGFVHESKDTGLNCITIYVRVLPTPEDLEVGITTSILAIEVKEGLIVRVCDRASTRVRGHER